MELLAAFYRYAVTEAKELTQPPTLPKQRQIPRRIDNGAPNHHFATPEEFDRKWCFEVLDLLAWELERRFNQKSFNVLKEIKRVLVESCNGKDVQYSEIFENMYAAD